MCPMCKVEVETLEHRLWECEEITTLIKKEKSELWARAAECIPQPAMPRELCEWMFDLERSNGDRGRIAIYIQKCVEARNEAVTEERQQLQGQDTETTGNPKKKRGRKKNKKGEKKTKEGNLEKNKRNDTEQQLQGRQHCKGNKTQNLVSQSGAAPTMGDSTTGNTQPEQGHLAQSQQSLTKHLSTQSERDGIAQLQQASTKHTQSTTTRPAKLSRRALKGRTVQQYNERGRKIKKESPQNKDQSVGDNVCAGSVNIRVIEKKKKEGEIREKSPCIQRSPSIQRRSPYAQGIGIGSPETAVRRRQETGGTSSRGGGAVGEASLPSRTESPGERVTPGPKSTTSQDGTGGTSTRGGGPLARPPFHPAPRARGGEQPRGLDTPSLDPSAVKCDERSIYQRGEAVGGVFSRRREQPLDLNPPSPVPLATGRDRKGINQRTEQPRGRDPPPPVPQAAKGDEGGRINHQGGGGRWRGLLPTERATTGPRSSISHPMGWKRRRGEC